MDISELKTLSKLIKSIIINAGDGTHEHPTQAILDMMSLKEKFGLPEGIDPNSERARFIQRLQRAETGSAEAESIAQEALENIF